MSEFSLALQQLQQLSKNIYQAIAEENYIEAEHQEDQRLSLLHRLPELIGNEDERVQLGQLCRQILEEDRHYQQRIEQAKQETESSLSQFMSQRRAVKAYHSGY